MTQVTVLRTLGPSLAKTWQADGTIKDYDLARQFKVRCVKVENIEGLHKLLARLQTDPQRCIVRGTPRAAIVGSPLAVERNLSNFADEPSHLFMVDCDGFTPSPGNDPIAAVGEYVDQLPPCFHDVSYVAQLSGSYGHPSKAGVLRCHLWFLLSAPLTCADAEAWTAKWVPGVDKTVHRTVQVNYTSLPVIEEGTDPIERRLWLTGGMLDELHLPADMPVPDAGAARVVRDARLRLVDARDKPGIIGALCRAYEPGQVVDLFPDHFEAGSKPDRLTWLHGGGSKEGLRITDSGTHLYNSHSTAPTTRACNLFDFIRLHVFGHLDTEPEAYELDHTAAPSYQATEEWARSQPEVQAELSGPKAEAVLEAAADAKAEVALSKREQVSERLHAVISSIGHCTDIMVMQHELAHNAARIKLFDDTQRELIAQAMQRRTVALNSQLSIRIIRDWLKPVALGMTQVFQDIDAQGLPKATIENLECLCANLGITIRYNVITKTQEIHCPKWALRGDDALSASIVSLQSECARAGMSYQMSLIKGYVCTIALANQYNPVQLMVDSRPWDGRSRIQDLCDTLESPPGTDLALKCKMLRTWLIQSIAVALSAVPIQARAVIVAQGPQYKGKSRWLKSLMPAGYEHLCMTGMQLDVRNKDHVKQAISRWLVELGELEGTFRKSDMAALKAWISQDEDVLRLPYAPAESSFQRRTSFFASANEEAFLNDPTGNTRFWVLAVKSMNADHTIDMQQLWAEIHELWKSGELHYLSQDDMASVNAQSEAHAVVDPIMERLAEQYAWQEALACPDAIIWRSVSATRALQDIGVMNPSPAEATRAGHALRKLGARQEPRRASGRAWQVPALPAHHTDM